MKKHRFLVLQVMWSIWYVWLVDEWKNLSKLLHKQEFSLDCDEFYKNIVRCYMDLITKRAFSIIVCESCERVSTIMKKCNHSWTLCQEFQRQPSYFSEWDHFMWRKKPHLPTLFINLLWDKKLNLDLFNTSSVMSHSVTCVGAIYTISNRVVRGFNSDMWNVNSIKNDRNQWMRG